MPQEGCHGCFEDPPPAHRGRRRIDAFDTPPQILPNIYSGTTSLSERTDTIGSTTGHRTRTDDLIFGLGDKDRLLGYGGNDTLYGGQGNDTLDAAEGNDRLWGEAGDDLIFCAEGNDTAYGGAGEDEIYGFTGNDVIDGGEEHDIVKGRLRPRHDQGRRRQRLS